MSHSNFLLSGYRFSVCTRWILRKWGYYTTRRENIYRVARGIINS
jgi:hypothetical protein